MAETNSHPSSVDDVADGLRAAGYLPGSNRPRWSRSWPPSSESRCWSRARPASARPSSPRRSRATWTARWCACSATRAWTRPRRSTSGTTASSCCGSRPRPDSAGWQDVQDDIFGEEFLLPRPLMTAIASAEPVVLLIDEIDKTDQEFEAMLLELLSDFQISIPELGRIEARTQPVVLLTSNNTRELTEALKRRCLYLWLDYPETRARARDRPPAFARARRDDRRASWSRSSTRSASSTSRSRRASPNRSTGPGRCCCSAPTTSTTTSSARR